MQIDTRPSVSPDKDCNSQVNPFVYGLAVTIAADAVASILEVNWPRCRYFALSNRASVELAVGLVNSDAKGNKSKAHYK